MSIKSKMFAMVGVLVFTVICIVVLGWQRMAQMATGTDEIVNQQFLPLINNDIDHLINDLERSRKSILAADSAIHKAVIAEKMVLVSVEQKERDAANRANLQNIDMALNEMQSVSSTFDSEETAKLYADFQEAFAKWKVKTRKVFDLANSAGKHKFAKKVSNGGSAEKRFNSLSDIMNRLSEAQESRAFEAFKSIDEKKDLVSNIAEKMIDGAKSGTRIFVSIGIATAVFIIASGLLLAFGITNSIAKVVTLTKDIAEGEGDLTKRLEITNKDELGDLAFWFNQFVANVQEIVNQVKLSSEKVSLSSKELASGNDDLSQRSQEQASSLEEISSSMEEMTSTVAENASNAKEGSELANEARIHAQKGAEITSKAILAVNEISEGSVRIADIIGVIDEIAFQTNLLALNAAIEAARAGDQGRGFSVVASEVRNLAGRSAASAKEIKDLINETVGKVDEGTKLVRESGDTLGEIFTSVDKVNSMMTDIAAASLEQSEGIKQVNAAISQMDEMTQQSASIVEETAATSEHLSGEAEFLTENMSRFKIT